ncbi:MAG: hypothetical protein DWQ07_20505 [Chloroflexi bacterium]|nr:MAG: hypothetical protein DWQ07_20505 [Chloroflexota bacterium]MBL1194465.1 hypothetical protein [Chloroflexota bacterium]NOH11753.1 hypothetical protein [Chloroflexota bacterium]
MDTPLHFPSPLLNASGSLGFALETDSPIDLNLLGAFITKPISRRPRQPASGQRLSHVSGGVLMHNGHPNPGLSSVLKTYAPRWAESPIPIIVHLLGGADPDLSSIVERLEMQENIMAVELGLPWDISVGEAVQITKEGLGELPLIVRLPLPRAFDLAGPVMNAGAVALSLGPPRGATLGEDGSLLRGRLYGPSNFPQAFQMVDALAEEGYTVIGAGGVYSPDDARAMLDAGAIAVQLDTVLWRGDAQALFEGFNE